MLDQSFDGDLASSWEKLVRGFYHINTFEIELRTYLRDHPLQVVVKPGSTE